MKLSPLRRFLYTTVAFAIPGAAFKVMTLIEGLTEIRPGNAIPMVAGLLCGPFGALGCAVGNVIADCFGSFGWTSVLGLIGNFTAAYLPWRLWYLFSREKPNVHTYKNIALYIGLSLLSALTVAWILGFGLELFFDSWIENIYRYVLYNNFAFSLILGLPLFIVLTSDGIRLEPSPPPPVFRKKTGRTYQTVLKITALIYSALMILLAIGVFCGYHFENSVWMAVGSAASAMILVALCVLPRPSEVEKQ